MILVADKVREASAVVALETTLIAHGFPTGEGVAVGFESERRIREAGAVPATIGVLDGQIHVGLSGAELERFDLTARKIGPRDLAACVEQRAIGATTVGGTLAVCRAVGIRVMGTGGLETLGVPVLGFRTDDLPLFYSAHGGPPVPARVESAAEGAEIAATHWDLGGGGLLLARPPDTSLEDVEPLLEEALAAAARRNVKGQAVTPFVLAFLHERSEGRTLTANRELVVANAGLAAEVATALSASSR